MNVLYFGASTLRNKVFSNQNRGPHLGSRYIYYIHLHTWQFCWWPFWHGENVALSKAGGVLQRSKIKFGHFESPWCVFLIALLYIYIYIQLQLSGQIIIFHPPRFCWNSWGPISLPICYLLGAQVLWGRYDLTRIIYYVYTWNPNDPCFDWSLGLVLGGWPSKIEIIWVPGRSSRYV